MSSVSEQPDIGAKVEFLSRPDSYPDLTVSVEAIETHRSWVFLTDSYAYKLKKPVRSEAFDFSSLDARCENCQLEICLNRRLAENVYLSVVCITIDKHTRLAIEGEGEPIEWLVKMRKLDRNRMLDHCIANSTVTPNEVESVAQLLCAFYRRASPVAWSGVHYCHHLANLISSSHVLLRSHALGLSLAQINAVANGLSDFVDRHRAELAQRVRDGRVIDAHGDLRPEHICLELSPVVIDCLEFNPDLRILDTASEMLFLIQECELLGAADVGQQLWAVYCRRTGDQVAEELCHFYRGYHAFLRASLAVAHFRDDVVRQPEKWKRKAQRYLDAATKADTQSTHPH